MAIRLTEEQLARGEGDPHQLRQQLEERRRSQAEQAALRKELFTRLNTELEQHLRTTKQQLEVLHAQQDGLRESLARQSLVDEALLEAMRHTVGRINQVTAALFRRPPSNARRELHARHLHDYVASRLPSELFIGVYHLRPDQLVSWLPPRIAQAESALAGRETELDSRRNRRRNISW